MSSLRTRLFVYLVAGAAALFLVAGIALTRTISGWLQREFDRGLVARARGLIAITEQEGTRIEFDFAVDLMPEFRSSAHAEYFELWLADGSLFQRSPSFEASETTRRGRLTLAPRPPADAPRFEDLTLPDGRRGRQVRIDFVPRRNVELEEEPDGEADRPPARPPLTLLVARGRERLDAALLRLNLAIGAGALVLTLGLAGLTQIALRVGLRSLDRLDRQVRDLDVTSLGARILVQGPPREIGAVIEQINALLERLEAGFQRERRLSSDIAHELKTPIAELRSLCEVGTRWPDDRAAVRRFFEDAGAIALQMERIVTHLLALARYDEGRELVRTGRVPVAELVEGAWRPLAQEAAARRIALEQRVSPALALDTDRDKLSLMVSNILSNAVAYSAPGTTVVCAAEQRDGRASVSFSNRAENLDPGDLAVMFDRFWRKDEARSDGRSAGLGLSLVRAMADLLDIEVAARLDSDRTFRLTLSARATG